MPQGGTRAGAGRKSVPEAQRKANHPLYLTREQYDKIMDFPLEDAQNFSQKCSVLIERGMESESGQPAATVCDPYAAYAVPPDTPCLFPLSTAPRPVALARPQTPVAADGKIRFIDLFAGIGGIRKGFEDETTRCVFSSEWDKYAAKTYEANYHEKPYGDITKIKASDIPDHECLLAGFPCQPFSNIGRREGFAHKTQGTLFFDVLRILKEKQPKMFLLENVKGLLTNDHGNTFRVIIDSLEEVGYYTTYHVLDAQDFGLPQRRERVVIVGFRSDLGISSFDFPTGNPDLRIPIASILEHDAEGYSISEYLQRSYLFKKDDGRPQLVDSGSQIQVNTLCASYHKIQRLTGTFVRDGKTGIRLFTEKELKRLMGFPDDFIVPVSRTQMYREFGNSVAVPMIRAVATQMKEALAAAKQHGRKEKTA